MDYSKIGNSKDFLNFLKYQYTPKPGKVQILKLPERHYLTFDGKGESKAPPFQEAIQCLYATAYTLKMGMKFGKLTKPDGYFDYKVPALEGLWWFKKGKFVMGANLKNIFWKLIIMTPAFITKDLVDAAKKQAKEKKQELPIEKVNFETFDAKKVIQTLHIGPYNKEEAAVNLLHEFAKEKGFKIAGRHHEIYMSDPHKTPESKLKTIIRYQAI